ncbi:extensin family protein [Martelella endophytica]|uniref:extensin-like domain-containing protein n=1 Tax=Martelella endophytica TaxID=1486262 RepID=UPI000695E8AC|nr:extensin family protein [Martelella endophytica]
MAKISSLRHAASISALSVALASCSIGGLMTSFSIDTADKSAPVVTRSEETEQGATQVAAAKPADEPSIEQLIAETVPASGTSIDDYLGFAPADKPSQTATKPVPQTTPVSTETALSPPAAPTDDPGIDPIETASLLPLADPGGAPRQSRLPGVPGLLPFAERQCRSQLNDMGVTFSEVAAIASGSHCGIAYPVKIQSLRGGINVSPDVTVNCETALAFAQWMEDDVAPAVRVRYLTGVKSVNTMGGYSCRAMNNGRNTGRWSEHSTGNAIDVGGITLNNGHTIDVGSQGFFAFREKGLMKSIRASSCSYFSTVLGPGYPKHDDHFHFDLMQRKSGKSYCK